MLSVVQLEPGSQSEVHSHPPEQWGVIIAGSGVPIQDGVEHPETIGDFWRTPGDVPHAFRAGPDGAKVLDIFSPPRDEYRTAGTGVFAPFLKTGRLPAKRQCLRGLNDTPRLL